MAGGREASGTGTLSTKWHLWCNPHRLTWFSNLSVNLKPLCGLLHRQTPPPEMRVEGQKLEDPSVRVIRCRVSQGHHCGNTALENSTFIHLLTGFQVLFSDK